MRTGRLTNAECRQLVGEWDAWWAKQHPEENYGLPYSELWRRSNNAIEHPETLIPHAEAMRLLALLPPKVELIMKPALTAEEWATRKYSAGYDDLGRNYVVISEKDGVEVVEDGDPVNVYDPNDRHVLAALALYGQPFGFTREDVEMLRNEADDEWPPMTREYKALYNLADRIEALLPPEG